ncbi:hypothetical protein PCANB_000782 [Pneumocystis canis]|nr:hypothetical protein PCANB_000782 [Pneumocystis canis]
MFKILYRKDILKFLLLNIIVIAVIILILIIILSKYNYYYQKYPILTLSITNSLLGGISNISAQTISGIHFHLKKIDSSVSKKDEYEMENLEFSNIHNKMNLTHNIYHTFSFLQLIRFMSYSFFTTPIQSWWYSFLEQLSSISKTSSIIGLIKRILMDQFLFTPISLVFFIIFMSLTEELSKKRLKKKFKEDYISILKANYCIWPAIQFINFKYIPLKYQIPFLNSISVFWVIKQDQCIIFIEKEQEKMKEVEIGVPIAISEISEIRKEQNILENERRNLMKKEIEQSEGNEKGLILKNEIIFPKENIYTQRKTIGDWQLGKTLGSGSMGKVKVVTHCITNEIAAVKIIPRPLSHHSHLMTNNSQDHAKEIRTIREIAISSLLQHPYICALRDVKIQPNHYYVFFEYINGGQMLDYIISHGKLKEKQARKFARQIGSALDYCHRNSIVHRDLKIENILISKDGDIKIIDFGLSNLYSPHSQLSTFCGSLYFAAPELLNAKAYIGPEIDIWSFGVVLYVLVCGKVPFDDQNMPALHAKIKRGYVEYPSWLTAECKQLLSRMLVTTPSQRATLSEILNHPWMIRGYDCPPDNYLPPRFPITFPLDMEVIRGMTGFEFGNEQAILTKLNNILESEGYRKLIKAYYGQSNDTHILSLLIDKKKTFFDFYKRKLPNAPYNAISISSSENIIQDSSKVKPVYIDAYHPLISIYYLVKEKIDREKRCIYQNSQMYKDLFKTSNISTSMDAGVNHLDYKIRHGTIPATKNVSFTTRARARTYDEKEVSTFIKNIPPSSNPNHNTNNVINNDIENNNINNIVDNNALTPIKDSKERNFKIFRRFSSRKIKEHLSSPNKNHAVMGSLELPTLLSKKSSNKYPFNTESLQQMNKKNLLTKQNNATHINRPKLRRSVSVNNDTYLSKPKTSLSARVLSMSKIHLKEAKGNVVTENKNSSLRSSNTAFNFRRNRAKSLGNTKSEVSQKETKCHRQSSALVMHNTPVNLPDSNQHVSGYVKFLNSNQTCNSSHEVTVKSGFLKGIFSVSTTSSKPPHEIRNDLIRILNRLNISYRDVKGGFFCIYRPSIDLKNFATNTVNPNIRHVTRNTHVLRRSVSLHKTNFGKKKPEININSNNISSDSDDSINDTGNTIHTHLNNFTIQFEIYIVKVPLFALHGLQFKRMGGNTWQYRSLASRIIAEMKL